MLRIFHRWIFCLLLIGALVAFGKSVLKATAGGLFRFALKTQCGSRLAYRALEWEEGRLVFVDPVLFDVKGEARSYHGRAERIEISFSFDQFPRQLGVFVYAIKPHVTLFGAPKLMSVGASDWIDLRMKVEEGFVEWPEMKLQAKLKLEKTSPRQIGRAILETGSSKMQIEALREGSGLRIDAAFSQFDATLLQPWADWADMRVRLESGEIDGWIHLESLKGEWVRGSAHGEGKDIAVEGLLGKAKVQSASFDWDGNFGEVLNLLFTSTAPQGRVRFDCVKGSLESNGRGIEEISGSFSYHSDLGIRCEWSGTGISDQTHFPLSFQAKGFWPTHADPWLEAELLFPKGRCALKVDANDKESRWSTQVEQLQPPCAQLLQELASKKVPFLNQWIWKDGSISCGVQGSFDQGKLGQWKIDSFEMKNMIVCLSDDEDIHLGLGSFAAHIGSEGWKGGFSLEGGHARIGSLGREIRAWDWSAAGTLADGQVATSRWHGLLNEMSCEGAFSGGAQWQSEGECQNYKFALQGSWKEGILVLGPSCVEGTGLSWRGSGTCDLAQWDKIPFSISTQRLITDLSLFSEHNGKVESDHLFCSGNLLEPPSLWEWEIAAHLSDGNAIFPNGFALKGVSGRLIATPRDWTFEEASAELIAKGHKLKLQTTRLSREGDEISFDLRVRRGFWDLARVVGVEKRGNIVFDRKKTELLGNPLVIDQLVYSSTGLDKLTFNLNLPWNSLLSLWPLLEESGLKAPLLTKAPLAGSAAVRFSFLKDEKLEAAVEGIDLHWRGNSLPFSFRIEKKQDLWRVEGLKFGDFSAALNVVAENGWWMIRDGQGAVENGLTSLFEGKWDESGRGQISFKNFQLEAAPLLSFLEVSNELWSGTLKGQGCVTFDLSTFEYETDFDFAAIDLKVGSFHLENRGPVHAFYSPSQGLIFQGVDLHAEKEGFSSINCKIGLMQYDALRSHWILNHAHVHLPGPLVSSFLKALDADHDIDFIADIQCASDFSNLSCTMKEGFIPFGGALRHLKDLHLRWDENRIFSNFSYFHQNRSVNVGFHVDRGSRLTGRLILEDSESSLQDLGERPLSIDWEYEDHFGTSILSIEGSFGGVEASFHSESIGEKSQLIGSARIHFGLLSQLLPPSVAEVFTELEMGKGYELKGRLNIDRKDLSQIFFKGILSGKQLELFGYQLRTLLAQVDLGPEKMRIYDLKISDSGGILKIDEMLMGGEGDNPWTISIPLISILELRPSLLQKPGDPPGEISPLVVREMKIRDFQGMLADGNTYTAHGELHFINSYKREHTVFDIPSDVLGRIIGLDMELLIPVCGTLRYVLKDGAFRIHELEDAYSEGQRSQFFLVHTDESPTVDLDGNIQIHVKMKQYVLFKLTEAFVISIDGKLNDPHYHLQKKKRFLGL